MLIEDRSSMEADWRCGMERYWLTEFSPPPPAKTPVVKGIVATKQVLELALGAAFADGIAILTETSKAGLLPTGIRDRIELVSQPILDTFGRQYYDLIRGLLYGAYVHVIPRLLVEYEILGSEKEVYFAWPPAPLEPKMMWMSRPDLLLRRKSDATVWVPDWKTTKWRDLSWLLKWPFAIQLHIQAAAVKQSFPEWDVQGSMIFGAYKGYVDEYTNLIRSPFVNIYHASGKDPANPASAHWSPKYLKGWDVTPVSVYPGDIYGWIDELKRVYPIILAEQFPVSQPILLRDDLVSTVAEERLSRLKRIKAYRDGLLNMVEVFDHRTLNCDRCPYKQACWTPAVHTAPTESGLYVPRIPNHMLEKAIHALDFPEA